MARKWRDVPGFEGRYRISIEGCVKSLTRTRRNNGGVLSPLSGRILKQCFAGQYNYLTVNLCRPLPDKGFKAKSYYVHRLVWEAFRGPIPDGKEIHHKDGNRRNNSLSNLQLVTKKEHTALSIALGQTKIHNKGSENHMAVLTEDKVKAIRNLYATGKFYMREIAARFSVCTQSVYLIINRQTWKHV